MKKNTLASRIIEFNKSLQFSEPLPEGIRVMNPFIESKDAMAASQSFYHKYYNDNEVRRLILGINPGRFGAGSTGVPFTDPKHLISHCGIQYNGKLTYEPSSVFVYDMINAYGGVKYFYKNFFIGAVCPLGFTKLTLTGKEINYNYYDSKELIERVNEFIVESLYNQINLNLSTDKCFCLGTGKNFLFLTQLNNKYGFFKEIIPLEHPRFIMQYRLKRKDEFITKYLKAFQEGNEIRF